MAALPYDPQDRILAGRPWGAPATQQERQAEKGAQGMIPGGPDPAQGQRFGGPGGPGPIDQLEGTEGQGSQQEMGSFHRSPEDRLTKTSPLSLGCSMSAFSWHKGAPGALQGGIRSERC